MILMLIYVFFGSTYVQLPKQLLMLLLCFSNKNNVLRIRMRKLSTLTTNYPQKEGRLSTITYWDYFCYRLRRFRVN
jgi:hypothetical protein